MEDNTDDQSSGWFEVKKKHRRFSIQGLVGGFSNKIPSQSSAYNRSSNSHSRQKFHASKAGESFGTHVETGSGNSITVAKEAERAVPCLDKCIVTEHIESPNLCSANFTSIGTPTDKAQNVQVAVHKEQSDMPRIPKIKWGDLEDDVLLVYHDNLDAIEIGLGDLGDDNTLTCRTSENLDDSLLSDSCCTVPQEDKSVLTLADAEYPSLVQRGKYHKEICKDIRESCPSDTGLKDENDEMLRSDDPCFQEIAETHVKLLDSDASDGLNSSNPEKPYSLSLPLEEVGMLIASQGHHNKPEDGSVTISSLLAGQLVSSTAVDSHDSAPPVRKSVPELSVDVSIPNFKDWNGSQDGIVNADKTETEIMDVTEEGESSESKERFRERLWCFLFENLNRSLDELYLLCELECDLEQLKEAILVLEEAGSDFKELKSRVEDFEIVKKPSQSLDGLPVYGKTDHRRAHALSWEVRRMAASPHRAEILSSSLEAFKKIQKERIGMRALGDTKSLNSTTVNEHLSTNGHGKLVERNDVTENVKETVMHSKKQTCVPDLGRGNAKGGKKNMEGRRSSKAYLGPQGSFPSPSSSTLDPIMSQVSSRVGPNVSVAAKSKREPHGSASELQNQVPKKDKIMIDSKTERNPKYMDPLKRHLSLLEKEKEKEKDKEKEKEKEKEKRDSASWRSLDAWKKKRNWEDILASPLRLSSRVSHSPGMSRKNMERTRVLHDKLMSPEKKKKTASDLKKEAEEKHARATRIRSELENERLQRLQRTSEKLIRVNEWQAVRTVKLKEGMHARHQRSESRHEAYLAQVVRRAGDESSKVNEVRFITSLNEENKKHILRQKLHDSKLRRAEKLHIIKTKQKEDSAREEAVSERRRLIQAEKLQRLAEIHRKKEEAQIRREEERKASSAAREARAIEQLRRKEVRAKAQQEEAELLAQKLAERLSESEQRRKIYLEQIRERASMDFRDQSSPLLRRSSNKDSLPRSTSASNVEDYYPTNISNLGGSFLGIGDTTLQHSLKRKIKKIRQRLMVLKHEFTEPSVTAENAGYNSLIGTARAKIGRWIQDLQRFRQARKEGASSIGLIVIDMIKFLDGKETELHASRQAGLLDFLASALPASHTSKPEACQVTTYLLRLLKVVLSIPENRRYFLAHNLLPPMISMLSAALENYIKIAASINVPGNSNSLSDNTAVENFDSVSEVLEGFIWTVTTIMGHICSDERQTQMKDFLLELVISYQVIHRLRELFALHDRPQVEGSPFPVPIILSLNMLVVLTSRPDTVSSIDWGSFPSKVSNENHELKILKSVDIGDSCRNVTDGDHRSPLSESCDIRGVPQSDVAEDGPLGECILRRRENSSSNGRNFEKDRTDVSLPLHMHFQNASGKFQNMKQPLAVLLSAITETGLVSLPSLLTAVLLQANNRLSSEQGSYVLPSNFEEVATGVLKVLNNLAVLDITLMQRMLARPDLKMEFFHLMSFLLSHCTSKWRSTTDQVGMLLLESLLLLGYFAMFHPGNQAVLRWGKSPTILHKVCDLPFVFFSDSELMPIIGSTLVSACFECEQNRGVIQQELSTEMLLSLVGSCRSGSVSSPFPSENNTTRNNLKSSRLSLGKGGGTRVSKVRSSTSEQWALKHNLPTLETSSTFMLHSRFPTSFIDKAEEFFSAGVSNLSDADLEFQVSCQTHQL